MALFTDRVFCYLLWPNEIQVSRVRLEARRGKIIISKPANSREGWDSQIKQLVASNGDPTGELYDMNVVARDDLEDLPWDGPSFEEWQKGDAKLP